MTFVSDAIKCSMFVMVAILIVFVMLTKVISDAKEQELVNQTHTTNYNNNSQQQQQQVKVTAAATHDDELYDFVHSSSATTPTAVASNPLKKEATREFVSKTPTTQKSEGVAAYTGGGGSLGGSFGDSFESWTS